MIISMLVLTLGTVLLLESVWGRNQRQIDFRHFDSRAGDEGED